MVPPIDSENAAKLDAARTLQSTLENTRLHIVDYREQFDSQRHTLHTDPNAHLNSSTGPADPAIITANLASQIAFLRKLKVQYLEQKAKDQYIKTIVSDDAPNIMADDNETLRLANVEKKEALRVAKGRLAEKDDDIRKFAPLVEQDYIKARTLTHEAASLSSKILDARLRLTRLRQAHPPPRLTVPAAHVQLDAQVAEMQTLDDSLQALNAQVEHVKDAVKGGARELERLRVERADAEKCVRAGREEVEDGRVVGLYDWFTAALALHRALLSLETFHSASENELHLTYALPPLAAPGAPKQVRIVLLFVPNTRQLADAQVEGVAEDVGDVVGAHVQANDVPGLIAAILARARAEQEGRQAGG
ncbi:hypothetical protein B0H21DRAFT_743962 [Amylocystis lapponica]|nr:hypothetical protein B0H21DRAFT_743962 [Amylocystis lapponica]